MKIISITSRISLFGWLLTLLVSCAEHQPTKAETREWLAGDHHIHSRFSVGWDLQQTPPAPILGGDAIYPTPKNAEMARSFGLSWMVTTDHGGPNHSKVNIESAYPELQLSRQQVPEVIQFYGMELNTPAGDHSSLIIPHVHNEAALLAELESGFDKSEAFPLDQSRDTEDKMIDALIVMRAMEIPPVVIANHPSRSATDYGVYGLYEPREFRRWNDTAPQVAVGMAGAPGHQAIALSSNEQIPEQFRARGAYGQHATRGGFDQMTAVVGGFWDSMLGEGRRWWITANSDSHVHYSEGGIDFWPGEYSKTYVHAEKTHDSILANLRSGHVFVTTGDLVSSLNFTAASGDRTAMIGEQLNVEAGQKIVLTIRFIDPDTDNPSGDNPTVKRVDVIAGDITGPTSDPTTFSHPSAKVIKRFDQFVDVDGYQSIRFEVLVDRSTYFRVRGTNTNEAEPLMDPQGEDPWQDLWFYSNPIFIVTD